MTGAQALAAATAVLTLAVVGVELFIPLHVAAPGAQANINTVVTICALVSAGLFTGHFRYAREVSDLLLACVLAAMSLPAIACSALAMTGAHDEIAVVGAVTACGAVAAIAFGATALAPRRTLARGRWRSSLIHASALATITLAEVLSLLAATNAAPSMQSRLVTFALGHHAIATAVALASSGTLVITGAIFLSRDRYGYAEARLLAGACFLVAASVLPPVMASALTFGWLAPVDGLRLAAYALLLVVAIRRYAEMRHNVEEAALRSERERIARDLHDGLAQDLAFIAAHVPQLRSQAGPRHPLTIAAERALAASRGFILDLSASTAPTTSAALRNVAEELSARFGAQVDVRVENERALRMADNLASADREHLVRIGREAIVNAAAHGGARTIEVLLECRGPHLLLTIRDDGCGLEDTKLQTRHGFGLAAMGARAESLGGLLSARSETDRGTVVEVTVPDFGLG